MNAHLFIPLLCKKTQICEEVCVLVLLVIQLLLLKCLFIEDILLSLYLLLSEATFVFRSNSDSSLYLAEVNLVLGRLFDNELLLMSNF